LSQHHEYVDAFLPIRGIDREQLRGTVSDAFGSPRLTVVAGSVAVGFGNSESDVDVFTVVDRPDVSPLPIPSYIGGTRVGVRYFTADAVRSWGRQLTADEPTLGEVGR
jgi:hypothetical protein